LTPAERRTLVSICETLMPALEPRQGDDPRLFRVSAKALGVAQAFEEALARLDPAQVSELRLLLRVMEFPLTTMVLVGRTARLRGFSKQSRKVRERALLSMAYSFLPRLRTAFQGLKRLAVFLSYSLVDGTGTNPTWEPIGYWPVVGGPAAAPLVDLTSPGAPTTFECDVCIIGSGAGGGVVAAEAAAAGKSVVVLEAASGAQAPDFDQHELTGMKELYLDSGMTATHDLGLAILAGAALGGGTAINWQTCIPLPEDVRDEWATASGCEHFTGESFSRSQEAVMRRLSVGTEESVLNANNDALRRGCELLGYRWHAIPRNAHGCDPAQCGSCVFGCRHGGKQSTAVTYLRDAQEKGNTQVIANCHADRLLITNGRVQGVLAICTDPVTKAKYAVRVLTRAVVVAAGAIHSPAILMRSGVELPALGRNLFLHPTSAVAGVYRQPVETWSGPPQTIMCDEFARRDGPYGFRLETAPGHPGLIALACPWAGARDHRRLMQRVRYLSAIIVLTRDKEGGRIRLGRSGRPVIEYTVGKREHEFLRWGIFEAARVHLAAMAPELLTLHTRKRQLREAGLQSDTTLEQFLLALLSAPVDRNRATLFSAHQMGTCRMGSDPRSAVCDSHGQVFGVDGLFIADASAFPLSSGVNPMITVMAVAHHTSQYVKAY
jgi:choline dehydrogenase-like flavoprotein